MTLSGCSTSGSKPETRPEVLIMDDPHEDDVSVGGAWRSLARACCDLGDAVLDALFGMEIESGDDGKGKR